SLYFFFFTLLLPPPISSLFPYTTLFRSCLLILLSNSLIISLFLATWLFLGIFEREPASKFVPNFKNCTFCLATTLFLLFFLFKRVTAISIYCYNLKN